MYVTHPSIENEEGLEKEEIQAAISTRGMQGGGGERRDI